MTTQRGEVIPLPQFTLGDFIRKARTDAQMEQEELAQAIGVSRPLVSRWECNKSTPNVQQFRALIRTTGATWLLEFFTSDEAA